MAEELLISSTTDTGATVEAVAAGEEARDEPKFVAEELAGVSREHSEASPRPIRALSYEHPQSSRIRVLEALAEAEAELGGTAKQVATNQEVAETEPEPEDIAEARRRNDYYQQQQAQHFSNPQAELQALRAELLPSFQAKVKVLLADADVKQIEEASRFPLSDQVLDALLSLPGGVESTAFLMKNPAEVRKLSALPAHMGIAHVAALANRFNPAAHRRVSAAPVPIRPLTGSPTTSALPADELPYQEFKKRREQEIRARRR
jgi:hypothetical protein